jgi:hypothetical protein
MPQWLVYWTQVVRMLEELLKATGEYTLLIKILDFHLKMLRQNRKEDQFETATTLYSISNAWLCSKGHQSEASIDKEIAFNA